MAKWLFGEQPASDALDNQINRINKMLVSAAKTLGKSSALYKSYEAQIAKLHAYGVLAAGKQHTMVRYNKDGVIQISRGKMAQGKLPAGAVSNAISESDRAANIQRILNEFDTLAKNMSIRSEKKKIEQAIRESAAKKGKPMTGKISAAQIQAAAKKLASARSRVSDILDYLYAHEQAIEMQKQTVGTIGMSPDTRYENWHVTRGLNIARKKGQKRTYAELQKLARHAAAVQKYNREHGIVDIAADANLEDLL